MASSCAWISARAVAMSFSARSRVFWLLLRTTNTTMSTRTAMIPMKMNSPPLPPPPPESLLDGAVVVAAPAGTSAAKNRAPAKLLA